MRNKIIIVVVILAALVTAAYLFTSNKGEQSAPTNQQSVREDTNSYTDEYISVKYSNEWTYFTGDPQAPTEPDPCGNVWTSATKCVMFEAQKENKTYTAVGIGIFETSLTALDWCKSDTLEVYLNCTAADNNPNIVSAVTPREADPPSEFRIISQKGKVIVLVTSSPPSEQYYLIQNSLQVK